MFGKASEENKKRKWNVLWSFLVNGAIALLIFGPFILHNGGLFTLGDDFDAQELAFNIFANREIKELDIFFNWAIDLGSDFISAFSFYNLGSPFFWITLFFPPEMFPWLVGWILILKYAVAGTTSFLWLRRHTSEKTALFGSILYAFSGFQAMNMIFYHFHDVVALFPLLLIGLELLAEEGKKGIFALTVAINALVNWNFFVGEVIFAIFYYLCFREAVSRLRQGKESAKKVWMEVFSLLGEGILGVGIAGFLFIPTVYSMLSQPRIGDLIYLSDAFLWSAEDFFRNIKALLLPAEAMNNNSVLSEMNWYSAGAYLPMIGVILCVTNIIRHRGEKNPLSRGLLICLIIAAVPLFNSVFVAFNIEPYRRWYYMPLLLMALSSARTLEELHTGDERTSGIAMWTSAGVLALIALFALVMKFWRLPGTMESAILHPLDWTWVLRTAVAGVILTWLILVCCRNRRMSPLFLMTFGVCCFAWLTQTLTYLEYRDRATYSAQQIYTKLILLPDGLEQDVLPYRYAFLDNGGYFDTSMVYSLPSINSFISIVDPGITEFYDALGVGRHSMTVAGPMGTERLLSVKYYAVDRPEMVGFEELEPLSVTDVGGWKFYVYENYDALAIGFLYDSYILRSEFDQIPLEYRAVVMLHELVVRDEDEEKVAERLTHSDYKDYLEWEEVWDDERELKRREMSAQLVRTKKAFRLLYPSWTEGYVFLSVPFSNRWSATVNGEPVEILNINGLMAVPTATGLCDIRFYYDIRINILSFGISGVAFLITIWILMRNRRKRSRSLDGDGEEI